MDKQSYYTLMEEVAKGLHYLDDPYTIRGDHTLLDESVTRYRNDPEFNAKVQSMMARLLPVIERAIDKNVFEALNNYAETSHVIVRD